MNLINFIFGSGPESLDGIYGDDTIVTEHPRVYFLRSGDLVKIGTTADIVTRFACLRREAHGAPLLLVRLLHGAAREERRAHELFSQYRVRGEWFRISNGQAMGAEGRDVPRREFVVAADIASGNAGNDSAARLRSARNSSYGPARIHIVPFGTTEGISVTLDQNERAMLGVPGCAKCMPLLSRAGIHLRASSIPALLERRAIGLAGSPFSSFEYLSCLSTALALDLDTAMAMLSHIASASSSESAAYYLAWCVSALSGDYQRLATTHRPQ